MVGSMSRRETVFTVGDGATIEMVPHAHRKRCGCPHAYNRVLWRVKIYSVDIDFRSVCAPQHAEAAAHSKHGINLLEDGCSSPDCSAPSRVRGCSRCTPPAGSAAHSPQPTAPPRPRPGLRCHTLLSPQGCGAGRHAWCRGCNTVDVKPRPPSGSGASQQYALFGAEHPRARSFMGLPSMGARFQCSHSQAAGTYTHLR